MTSGQIIPAAAPYRLQSGLTGLLRINALGDSMTARDSFQPTIIPPAQLAAIPAWIPNNPYTPIGTLCQNNGIIYRLSTAGTSAASGGPTGIGSSADNTCIWVALNPLSSKIATSYPTWVEAMMCGLVVFDQSTGYQGVQGGLIKGYIHTPGHDYVDPQVVFTNGGGAAANLRINSQGSIIGFDVTNPGQPQSPLTGVVTDTHGGTGATLSFAWGPAGTFGVNGTQTSDMLDRLPDVIASGNDIICVMGGTNDVFFGTNDYNAIITNLRRIYEGLMGAGKLVIALPIPPRISSITTQQMSVLHRVNHWIRSYCRKESWANPLGFTNIRMADFTGYWTDGTLGTNAPIGGAGNVAEAVTVDALHQSELGAQYIALSVVEAIQSLIGSPPNYVARQYSTFDGYDSLRNPNGNLLEGLPWQASKAYALGDLVANDSTLRVYRCVTAGTSAASGGPTGTSGTITDNTAQWVYVRPAGISQFNSGTAGTLNHVVGIDPTGSLATGLTLTHSTGSADAGQAYCFIESPWNNGQKSQRQGLAFSLDSGTTSTWTLTALNTAYANLGLQASELGVTKLQAELEMEVSAINNLCAIHLLLQDSTGSFIARSPYTATIGAGHHWLKSDGQPAKYPNGGKLLIRTQPMTLPTNLTNIQLQVVFGFDSSGSAAAATAATLFSKINFLGIRKVGAA